MPDFKTLVLLLLLACLSACATSAYYAQLASGQWNMFSDRQPIEELLDNPATPADLHDRLQLVESIRNFATTELSLPDNPSYRYYVDLQRPYAVWNVYAAEEFSTTAIDWCFPIAGCVAYRGYFTEQTASDYAQQLSGQGLDSYVGGVAAYSTLGWFNDPVLNTFIYRDDAQLAGLVFHELAHQQLYLPGDTAFNESFARAVEVEGVRRWLSLQQRESLMTAYLLDQQLHQDFVATLLAGRDQLDALYAQDLPVEEMRRRKLILLETIQKQDYPAFKKRWGGTSRFDNWMAKDFNNAKLATLANYQQWVPAFKQMLANNGGNFQVFYQDARVLSGLEPSLRQQQLESLSTRSSAKLITTYSP